MLPRIKVINKCKKKYFQCEICTSIKEFIIRYIWDINTHPLHLLPPPLSIVLFISSGLHGDWQANLNHVHKAQVVFLELKFLCGMLKTQWLLITRHLILEYLCSTAKHSLTWYQDKSPNMCAKYKQSCVMIKIFRRQKFDKMLEVIITERIMKWI